MLKGREQPRVFTPPARELTRETSLGFLFIDFCAEVLGVDLLPWQKWLAIHAMEIEGDFTEGWQFRYRVICCLISRQNGKTFFLEPLALFHMYLLHDRLVLGTAQNIETAEEAWEGTISRAEENDELKARIARVRRSNGGKSFELDGGEKYRVVAATRKGARGKRGDLVIMDELREQQNWDGWGAISKTTLARPNAQLWAFSNAGDGTSVVLDRLRRIGHEQAGDPDGICSVGGDIPGEYVDDSTVFLAEWSAAPNIDLENPEQLAEGLAQANPSLGYGFLTERALMSAKRTDPPEVFKTECLCQWVTAQVAAPFPDGAWQAGEDANSVIAPDSAKVFGVDVSADRTAASIAVCGLRADRSQHVEIVAYRSGTAWPVEWFRQRVDPARPIEVALQGRGAPVSALAEVLAAIDGVNVVECTGRDVAAWSGRFYDAVCANVGESDTTRVIHRPQPVLELAASVAQTRPLGDGAWGFDRAHSDADISPLIACVMAHGAFNRVAAVEDAPKQSAYENGTGVMFL